MINFKTVKWKNFLSTGNAGNEVRLDAHNTTLIVGKNGEGKSTILDALCFTLFGKAFRSVSKKQLINSINQKGTKTEVEFSIGKNNYRVVRGIKPNIFEIYQNGTLLNQDAAARDYQKTLEQQILKLNYKTFTQVVILGSASFVPFMQLPPATRRDVIEDILDIRIFSTMNQLLRERIQNAKDLLQRTEAEVEVVKERVNTQKKLITTILESKKDSVSKIDSKIKSTKDEITSITDSISKISDDINTLRESISDQDDVKSKFTEAQNLISKTNHRTDGLKTTLEFFKSNDTCPSCEQGIPHEHKETMVGKIQGDQRKQEESLKTLQTALEKLEERINSIQEVQTEITAKTLEISGMNSSIQTLNKVITELLEEREKHHEEDEDLSAHKEELKQLAQEAMSMIDKKTQLAEHRNLQEIAGALLKDTGIKTAIIREYLPHMNKMINKYLSAMDFYVHFELDESFNEVIKSRYRDEFTYASFSEGEKMRIDIAILFTWRQIAKMKNSVNTNLLILDEIFDSSLDVAGTDYFLSVMSSLGENSNVFVISHKGDQLVDKFQNTIKFEKRNDFSIIVGD